MCIRDSTWITPVLNTAQSGLLLAADRFSEIIDRVSQGSIIASTHNREAAYNGVVCRVYLSVTSDNSFCSFSGVISLPLDVSDATSICNNVLAACSPPMTAIFADGHAYINLGS